ncbi:16S rRNA (guanine(527)-N(7))-methyltransferase RsmG [Pontibaca salina]|uniref:Ribosomal RNA small subunit methyltransferase G n=1 Tax=Pontibaca salina TaxID=2795731 RepID=A0A934HRD2_9RHOB|nr:16S rRNA (guanine(527)-N(7))-methyltransferase RsmG [Pontibaca salina]MBI6629496.1 16S rRNA (guanine(527)-N(7))-methyltransferase RsmG [Pontibaca salina]
MSTQGSKLDSCDVSRETIHRIEVFERVLRKWNPRINLVSASSMNDLWSRHILDSIQVYRCGGPVNHWVDMGTGGGFPGLIAALVAADEAPEVKFTLIESDQRKAAFLRTAARETGISCEIIAERIEEVEPLSADIVSARALTDLSGLLYFTERHLGRDGFALLPKGATWKSEVAAAQETWRFRYDPITSVTDPQAVILKIEGASLV